MNEKGWGGRLMAQENLLHYTCFKGIISLKILKGLLVDMSSHTHTHACRSNISRLKSLIKSTSIWSAPPICSCCLLFLLLFLICIYSAHSCLFFENVFLHYSWEAVVLPVACLMGGLHAQVIALHTHLQKTLLFFILMHFDITFLRLPIVKSQ